MSVSAGRPKVQEPLTFGGSTGDFWIEYPSGLVNLTREHPLQKDHTPDSKLLVRSHELEFTVRDERHLRLSAPKSAIIIIDMQNFFLHPDLRTHSSGLECVPHIAKLVPFLRSRGICIIWCNWGLTEAELKTIPPALARSFSKTKSRKSDSGGFGSTLPGRFGKLLMRGEYNSQLYGPLQALYEEGKAAGTDVWIHKNRMSGIWGGQSELDLYLQSQGVKSLLFAGVNADQCVLGTVVDAYFKGYDCILLEDCVATTSPEGGKSNLLYNCTNSYGFVTDSKQVMRGVA